MELMWNGVDGSIESSGNRWVITTRPELSFQFDDVYYAPRSRLVFKIVSGERQDLTDDDLMEILQYLKLATPPAKTLPDAITEKLALLAAKRYAVEVGGIVVGGEEVRTDRQSQALLNAAYVGLRDGFQTTVDWKNTNGVFVTLTLAQITPIAQAVFAHVQNCFTNESRHADTIKALTSTAAVEAYDFSSGW